MLGLVLITEDRENDVFLNEIGVEGLNIKLPLRIKDT